MIHSTLRAKRVSSNCHFQGILYQLLRLVFPNAPPHYASGCHINDSAKVQFGSVAHQFCNIRAPKKVGFSYGKLVLDQVFFYILLFCCLGSSAFAGSAAFGNQSVSFEYSRNAVFANVDPFSKEFPTDAYSSVVSLVLFKTVNDRFLKFFFFTVLLFGNTVILTSRHTQQPAYFARFVVC